MKKLYIAILENLDPFWYFEDASQYFILLRASEEPPEALIFSSTNEEDPSFAATLPRRPFSDQEKKKKRLDTLRHGLNSRYKGLLELEAQNRVQYLHRSARGYIKSHEVTERIQSAAGEDFDSEPVQPILP